MSAGSRWCYALAAGLLVAGVSLSLQAPGSLEVQSAKAERYPPADWSPTQGAALHEEYVGPAVCAECHSYEASGQKENLMAHAAALPTDSEVLREHPQLSFRQGPYSYQIRRERDRILYEVSDGTRTIPESLISALGFGRLGQTFIFEHDGAYYESRVSYFTAIANLDITIGHSRRVPASLEEALGNALSATDSRLCFSCHTTAAVTNHELHPSHLIPGVTCESCHGPGAKHVAGMKSGKLENTLIFNPARLNTEDQVGFCGACHRTGLQVIEQGRRGPQTVRFQPYRLTRSPCWDPTDARISCVACHDPHQALVRDAAAYDSKCQACHVPRQSAKQSQDRRVPTCPVGQRNCVTCHMPEVELPGGHARFFDHYIRVVRPGEPYPD